MGKGSIRIVLTKVVVALILLLGAGAAQAQTVTFDPVDQTKATGITGLDLGGTLYNVAFTTLTTSNAVYGDFPGVFDFGSGVAGRAAAQDASDAANVQLNAFGAATVGAEELVEGQVRYVVGFDSSQPFGIETLNMWLTSFRSMEWDRFFDQDTLVYNTEESVFATFTVAGQADISVPDVVGLQEADAEAAIVAAGLVVGTRFTEPSSLPEGEVIAQSPAADTSVPEGSAVDLLVASSAQPVSVPDVVGLQQADAEDDIEAAGLVVGMVSGVNHDTVPAGEVISQSPVGGELVAAGSPVDILVSDGPQAELPMLVLDGDNVIGILGLPVVIADNPPATEIYDVEFRFEKATTVYGPGLDFDWPENEAGTGEELLVSARTAVLAALNGDNQSGTIPGSAGPQSDDEFFIGHKVSPQTEGNVLVIGGEKFPLDWDTCATDCINIGTLGGVRLTDPNVPFTYADFTLADGSDPCADKGGDTDGDTLCDDEDNCPTISNTNQDDTDGDDVGDACDNCTEVFNPRVATPEAWMTLTGGQRDDDADGYGNICDGKFDTLGTNVGQPDVLEFVASLGKNRETSSCGTSGSDNCARYDLDEGAATNIGQPDVGVFIGLLGAVPGPRCAGCPLLP